MFKYSKKNVLIQYFVIIIIINKLFEKGKIKKDIDTIKI